MVGKINCSSDTPQAWVDDHLWECWQTSGFDATEMMMGLEFARGLGTGFDELYKPDDKSFDDSPASSIVKP